MSLFDEALKESGIKSYQDLNSQGAVENLYEEYQKAFMKKVTVTKKPDEESGQMSIFDLIGEQLDTESSSIENKSEQQLNNGEVSAEGLIVVHQDNVIGQIDIPKSKGSRNVLPYARQEFIKKVALKIMNL